MRRREARPPCISGARATQRDMRIRWVPRDPMAARAEPLPAGDRAGERQSQLTPTLTRKMLLLFIVGDILGGGIYARTGEVAGEIGGAIWTGVALAAGIAGFTAAPYAALGAQVPPAAGAALLLHKGVQAPPPTVLLLLRDVPPGH